MREPEARSSKLEAAPHRLVNSCVRLPCFCSSPPPPPPPPSRFNRCAALAPECETLSCPGVVVVCNWAAASNSVCQSIEKRRTPLPRSANPARTPSQFNSMRVMRCTLRFAPRPGIQLIRHPLPQPLSTFQCSRPPKRTIEAAPDTKPIASIRPTWELGKLTWSAFAALEPPRVGAVQEVNSLLRRHQLPQVCKCNRGLRCQLSCAKYPHPIPSHPSHPSHPIPIPWRQPDGPRHHAYVSRSPRCGHKTWPPSIFRCRRSRVRRASPSCNDHLSMQLTPAHNLGSQVTWSGP
jgi:hypothetical protein